jgi:zinc transport system substrate-binding protein
MISSLRIVGLLVLLLLPIAATAADKLVVYTVNYPLQYFAERIGGAHVDVHFPAPADVDPAFWKPDAHTLADYQRADLILLNGAGYAKWTHTVSLPRLHSVDTSRGFRDQYIKVSATSSHSHGPTGDHSHSGTAFTTWLDPLLAAQQASAIRDAFIKQRPDHSQTFSDNYARLQQDLLDLDKTFQQIVANQPGQPLLASHPVYQYFARRYNLNLRSLVWEADVDPREVDWQALAKLTSEHPARRMLWEAQPRQTIVKRLQGFAVHSVVFQACANKPAKGDYMSVMMDNIAQLRLAFPEFSIN